MAYNFGEKKITYFSVFQTIFASKNQGGVGGEMGNHEFGGAIFLCAPTGKAVLVGLAGVIPFNPDQNSA